MFHASKRHFPKSYIHVPSVDKSMKSSFSNILYRIYWIINRPFLRAFSEAIIGTGKEGFKPNGREIVAHLETFLTIAPSHVVSKFLHALIVLPVSPTRATYYTGILFWMLKVWSVVKSHPMRIYFTLLPRRERMLFVDGIFHRLNEQSHMQIDDIIKSIVVLINVKGLLSGAYMELDSTLQSLGYRPYSEREWDPPSGPHIEKPPRTQTSRLLSDTIVADPRSIAKKPQGVITYCIIGSGAGGAVAAYSILEQDKSARVVILEAGPLVTNDQFPRRVLESSALLYMNAGVTLTKDQMFTFRQGRTIGGSTTINNAIMFKPEGWWWDENIVKRWKSFEADVAWDKLKTAYDDIERFLNVQPIDDRIITQAAETTARGFRKLGYELHRVPVNLDRCIGCGRCNTGCEYDAKLSMNTTLLPKVADMGGYIVPNVKVETLEISKNGGEKNSVRNAAIKTSSGEIVKIEADKFILAAGAYASSKILLKSDFTGSVQDVRTVGKRFTCNFGSPIIGRFPTPQKAWMGQQIGYVIPLPDYRMIIETAFAPTTALGMLAPQWGNDFIKLVEHFDYLAVTAPTVGSSSYGQIAKGILGQSGYVIDYSLNQKDWWRLANGMKISALAMLEMGALEIYNTRFDGKTLKAGENVDDYIMGIGPEQFLRVESAHPTGGNVIHHDPRLGVVDEKLRVHGIHNLWICDASVIPASITLNLQMTVMALARYAALEITG